MKIVIAPDSYKESLTAKQVCQAIETGFKRVFPDAQYVSMPLADGGEGTVQSLIDASNGQLIKLTVSGPLGPPVDAFYGLMGDDTNTAVIEMAAASGLHHVPISQRDPKYTSSRGTGEIILAALDSGVKKIIIGLGGSATNDGGIGMLSALGVLFTDIDNYPVAINGAGLQNIQHIDISGIDVRLSNCEILVACDVNNPLCGKQGASQIFGPQKGATVADIKVLDDGLRHFANCIERDLGADIINKTGAGAAGGMAAALMAFTHAKLKPGIEIVLQAVNLQSEMKGCQLVITGEGCIDAQTIHGKTPMGVAQLAKKFNIPVIGIAGSLGNNHQAVYQCGIDAVFSTTPAAMGLPQAFAEASINVANVAENIAQLWALKIKTSK
jgi:glycerate 2-kinase